MELSLEMKAGEVTAQVPGTLWARSEDLKGGLAENGEGGGAASPSPSPLLCPLYPPVDPTSIPLQFLSTSGWPLKEIGFKL